MGRAVTLNDEGSVLEDLPGDLECQREHQPQPDRPARPDEPKGQIEGKAVNDVRKGVPVDEVL